MSRYYLRRTDRGEYTFMLTEDPNWKQVFHSIEPYPLPGNDSMVERLIRDINQYIDSPVSNGHTVESFVKALIKWADGQPVTLEFEGTRAIRTSGTGRKGPSVRELLDTMEPINTRKCLDVGQAIMEHDPHTPLFIGSIEGVATYYLTSRTELFVDGIRNISAILNPCPDNDIRVNTLTIHPCLPRGPLSTGGTTIWYYYKDANRDHLKLKLAGATKKLTMIEGDLKVQNRVIDHINQELTELGE